MLDVLHVLDASGDIEVKWDPADQSSVVRARAEVEELRKAGFSFFLVDGNPADEVAAGMANGTLSCRHIKAEEVVSQEALDAFAEHDREIEAQSSLNNATHPGGEFSKPEDWTPKKRRGRPAKTVVATKPLRGG